MFISEQYGDVSRLDGNYWGALLMIGAGMYWTSEQEYTDAYRDVDMMLIGL